MKNYEERELEEASELNNSSEKHQDDKSLPEYHNEYLTTTQMVNNLKWLQALKSGDYNQGYGRLFTPNLGFCCLGVACEELGLPYNEEDGGLPECTRKALGLLDRYGTGRTHDQPSLGYLNDKLQKSLSEIADFIDKSLQKASVVVIHTEGEINEGYITLLKEVKSWERCKLNNYILKSFDRVNEWPEEFQKAFHEGSPEFTLSQLEAKPSEVVSISTYDIGQKPQLHDQDLTNEDQERFNDGMSQSKTTWKTPKYNLGEIVYALADLKTIHKDNLVPYKVVGYSYMSEETDDYGLRKEESGWRYNPNKITYCLIYVNPELPLTILNDLEENLASASEIRKNVEIVSKEFLDELEENEKK